MIKTDLMNVGKSYANVYLLRGEHDVLVDTGVPGQFKHLLMSLSNRDCLPGRLKAIVITHAHFDHVGNAFELSNYYKVPIICHENIKTDLESGTSEPVIPTRFLGKVFSLLPSPGGILKIEVTTCFKKELDLQEYGVNGRILWTPGHTDGSCSILTDDGHAVIGDLLMSFNPLSNKPGFPYFATSKSDVVRSCNFLLEKGALNFYPGHGKVSKNKDVINLIKHIEKGAI